MTISTINHLTVVTIVTIIILMKRSKGQHYLLSAQARSLSLMEIMRLSDDEAFELFKQARWSESGGDPVCPRCGSIGHYWIKTRKQWRCKDCNHSFSVTSGTIFSNHKMPLKNYLAAIAIYSNAAKGISALQLSRDLNCQYKTAFVLSHKLRESLGDDHQENLSGEIEIDGCYVNKHVRPSNRIENRIDRRLKRNRNPNRRTVMVVRQRGEKGKGAIETRTFLTKGENQRTTMSIALRNVDRDSIIYADEHRAYDTLHSALLMKRVVHAEYYSAPDGSNTNQAESFFARFRRMQIGQMHKMSNLYMDRYANEAAYREDTRRVSNGAIFSDIIKRCAKSSVSRDLCGYWQSNKRIAENLAA